MRLFVSIKAPVQTSRHSHTGYTETRTVIYVLSLSDMIEIARAHPGAKGTALNG
jgi:hypothetical protein